MSLISMIWEEELRLNKMSCFSSFVWIDCDFGGKTYVQGQNRNLSKAKATVCPFLVSLLRVGRSEWSWCGAWVRCAWHTAHGVWHQGWQVVDLVRAVWFLAFYWVGSRDPGAEGWAGDQLCLRLTASIGCFSHVSGGLASYFEALQGIAAAFLVYDWLRWCVVGCNWAVWFVIVRQ